MLVLKAFFIIWTIFVVIAIILLCIRDGVKETSNMMFKDVLTPSFVWLIIWFALFYCYVPLLIPSIVNEIKEQNEKDRKSN